MAAIHRQIGVAYASYFPSLQLSAGLGFSSPLQSDFTKWKSLFWQFGSNISQYVFDAGRDFNVQMTWAEFQEASANYQQRVLEAFEEVENSLSNLVMLAKEMEAAQTSVKAANKAYELALERYRDGVTYYLEVVDTERQELQYREIYTNLLGLRYANTVQLIKSLGGTGKAGIPNMWIVKLAIRRPYTFVVVALCMLIFGAWFILRTPKDIFPSVDIPVVSVIWTYTGLSADEMAQRITTYSEYGLSNNVDDIARIESQTYDGIAVIRLYFYPEVEIEVAIAEATASSQSILRLMPQGVQPPTIVRYSANSVPIVQMAVSSSTLTGEELYDYAQFRIRQNIAVIQGVTLPTPYGGVVRQMMVDLDLDSMQSKGLSPRDINKAINSQSVILPVGDARIGHFDYPLNMNNTPLTPEDYNDIPVKVIDDVIVYLRDVAFAHDGFIPQVNVVRNGGKQCVLLTILKHGKSSTLDIINNIKKVLPTIQAAAPKGMEIELLFDQSFFVKAAIKSVVTEGLLAALLTGTMILIFLGSFRSTFIVLVSIPLSILTSIIILSLIGYTLNIMTLGGLALAIGILVDDATVTLENIHRNYGLGKSLHQAVIDGSSQIAIPAFVSTLCICIVFLPVSLLIGPARFLFIPFAYAVVFAIMTSYFLSRTLVPLMFEFLLEKELTQKNKESLLVRFHAKFEKGFHAFRKGYIHALHWALYFKGTTCLLFGLIFLTALFLVPFIGTIYFPNIDANQLRLHVRTPSGTRIELTQVYFSEVEDEIKKVLDDDFLNILDNIGLPVTAYNLAFGGNSNLSTADGDILISLKPDRKHTSQYYQAALRKRLNEKFPQFSFFFEAADMINQILQFGLPGPIDVRVIGYNKQENLKITKELVEKISHVPGAVDVHLQQIVDLPELFLMSIARLWHEWA